MREFAWLECATELVGIKYPNQYGLVYNVYFVAWEMKRTKQLNGVNDLGSNYG